MSIVTLYRPLLLLLLPIGLLLIASALFISVALASSSMLFLLLGCGVAGIALWGIHRWANTHFKIYGNWTYNGRVFAPILVLHHGVFNRVERSITLTSLVEVTIHRPLLWAWCGGAFISLDFADQERLELGLVNNAEPAVELLQTALQLNRQPTWPLS